MKTVIELQVLDTEDVDRPDELFGAGSWFSISSDCRMPYDHRCPA